MSDENKDGSRPGEPADGGLVFRYNRARRLESAPESVRWLSSRYGAKRPGVMKSLLGTRANRLLFFTILALVLSFNLVPLFFGSRSSGKLAGDRYSAKAFWFEDRVLVSVEREAGEEAKGEGFFVVVTARAEGDNAAGPVADATTSFAAGISPSESFRLALDCPAGKPKKLDLIVEREGKALELELDVD